MTVGDRGQVTIPKALRDRFGLAPRARVEFHVVDGELVLRKAGGRADFAKWRGRLKDRAKQLGFASGDDFVSAARGRDDHSD